MNARSQAVDAERRDLKKTADALDARAAQLASEDARLKLEGTMLHEQSRMLAKRE